MKFILSLICAATLCTSAMAQTQVIAHRGYWNIENSAQNSIVSLYKAAEIGCYGAEFDVQMTKDGKFIVFHDGTVNGMNIADTNYDLLRDIQLKNGETIPTLEQYLVHAKNCPDTQLILEIKTGKQTPEIYTQTVSGILALIDKYNLEERTEYIAFSADICKELVKQRPCATVHYLSGDKSVDEVKKMGLAGIDYHFSKYVENPALTKEAQKAGLKVNAWTINDAPNMSLLIENGVDFITTDNPELLQKLLKEKK